MQALLSSTLPTNALQASRQQSACIRRTAVARSHPLPLRATLAVTSRRSLQVVCQRGGRRSNRRRSDDGDLSSALQVLAREWPKLVLPAVGMMLALSFVGPFLISGLFLAMAVAGAASFMALPLFAGVGAAMLFGGLGVAATVGFAGLMFLPTLVSILAIAAGGFLGSRLVSSFFDESSSERRGASGSTVDVEYEDLDSGRRYDSWTGKQASGKRSEVDEDVERMRREAEEDLKTFDQMMKLKDKMRSRD